MVISPSAYPGYNWTEQAVSDLSAENAPSRMLWNQIAALYGICSVVCATCVSVFISERKVSTPLFRIGMHLFTIMNWFSYVGYAMFPLSDSGKEITLYRLFPGDMCMLSASCVLESITFDVTIDAEEDSECLIISGAAYNTLSQKNKDVRIFSLETAVSRFSDVMWVMQQILFMSMDRRLAVFLTDEAARTGSDEILLTHEQIARYIGSAREVVSRMLKYFSAEGFVTVSRKGVRITDKAGLRRLTV